jgi:hypothetical protein
MFALADIGTEILTAFGAAVTVLFAFIPALIGALIILLVGWIVATVVKNILVRVLRAIHFDQAMERAGVAGMLQRGGVRADAAGVLASLVYWFIFLIFMVAAANALGVAAITGILNAIVLWLPQLFVALIVLIIGALVARFVGDLIRTAMDGAGVSGGAVMAGIARYAILAFVAIIALNQIGVGAVIVQTLFASVMLGLALALALAFGLGGRETAKNIVDSWYSSMVSRQPNRTLGTPDSRPPLAPPSTRIPSAGPPVPTA